jgi:DNA-directed RNA polymerase subunit M/transcription elongation factor TFIIS
MENDFIEQLKKILKDNANQNFEFVIPVKLYQDEAYNSIRRRVLIFIGSIIFNHPLAKSLSYKDKKNITIGIELGCYNKTIKECDDMMFIKSCDDKNFLSLYSLSTMRITKNLDPSSEVNNDYLINLVLTKQINPVDLANLSINELCPEKSDAIIEKLKIRSNQKVKQKTSTLYRCSNCGKRETVIKLVQIRAMDESSSTSITCIFCKNRWILR